MQQPKSLFAFGQLVATPGALEALHDEGETALTYVARHVTGDWGDLTDEDKRANDRALKDCSRILSAYRTRKGVRIWIITEADRSVTTVLLPSEY